MFSSPLRLDLDSLVRAYQSGERTPVDVIDELYVLLSEQPHAGVFIHEVPHAQAREAAQQVMRRKQAGDSLPLYGVPFAVKDNIDVAGLETTAASPAFAYRAERNAHVVELLLRHGALLIGKTNLDQFATGLVGVRSPYGVPLNPFSPVHVPGGSSSGSAVAVASGFVSFALGTDTAGSGRVPAAFNNIVGLKPTRGVLSTHGVVPACRSLDCISVFALTVDDAATVAQLTAELDARDPYARSEALRFDPRPSLAPPQFRCGLPQSSDLVIRELEAQQAFARALQALAALGGSLQELPLEPFQQTAALLYEGPFVAERLEAAGPLWERDPEALHPVIAEILRKAERFNALDAHRGMTELARLRRECSALLERVDLMVVPSTSYFPRIAEVIAEPLALNSELGRYTNFVNLLDLCALAVPAGMRSDGLPFGVTLIARAGRDGLLASIGKALHERLNRTLGATGHVLNPTPAAWSSKAPYGRARLAVVGAHLSGQPLNRELTELDARFVLATTTAPKYRLYALDTTPPKPGLVRAAPGEQGHAIELEVWEFEQAAFGAFVSRIPSPLGVGVIELSDGSHVQGFLCESVAISGAREISEFGGWRAYRAQL